MKTFRTSALLLALVLVACGGGEGGDSGTSQAVDASDGTVQVEASDLAFDPTQVSVPAGEIQVVLDNVGAVEHDFVVEETGDTVVATAAPGETATGSIELEAGTYTFYCSIPGHREAGMEGTLEVQ